MLIIGQRADTGHALRRAAQCGAFPTRNKVKPMTGTLDPEEALSSLLVRLAGRYKVTAVELNAARRREFE